MAEFSLREFVKKTLLNQVGRKPYQSIRDTALMWLGRDILTAEDAEEIETAIQANIELRQKLIAGELTQE